MALVVPSTAAFAADHTTLHVSPDGSSAADCGHGGNPCATVMQAVMAAGPGTVIDVGPGTYHEQVVLAERVTLHGHDAVIDASGLTTGSGETMDAAAVLVTPSASGSTVEELTVRGAYGEGILVQGASHVRVEENTVTHNDLGTPENTTYAECLPQGDVPGDCGEGLHLMSATDSRVEDNVVSDNAGGILVTDELGAATRNEVVENLVKDNAWDCGITLPSHNPDALSATGARQPEKGGVYGNRVARNKIVDNGAKGEGAGVLIAAAGPGMATYDNEIVDNTITGNGMPGVTVHSHTPNQDVSGNLIARNHIGRNNLNGDEDAKVTQTTGILVFSPVVPTSVTIRHNSIRDNEIAVWTSPGVTVH